MMDKITAFLAKPFNLLMVALGGVIISTFLAYDYKVKKLAELEYREKVREKQQEIVDKYQEAEDEIKDRHFDMVRWNEKIKEEVNEEIEKAQYEDNNSQSYTITATDGNASKLLE